MKNSGEKVEQIMKVYQQLAADDDYDWLRWKENPEEMSLEDANKYFIGVMLDQGQTASRAWAGAEHLVDTHFETDNLWEQIRDLPQIKLKQICQEGFNGNSYALRHIYNHFPVWLKQNALMMIEEYTADPRNIWLAPGSNVPQIYRNFKSFHGIGDALAKMGIFLLARQYGIAGGYENRRCLAVKPDIHIRRVLPRIGLSKSSGLRETIDAIERLNLESPADFDAALWEIGREYCKEKAPSCDSCPVSGVCDHAASVNGV